MSTASLVAGLGNIIPSRIVHKLTIEGHCHASAEGASLRLYMKVGHSSYAFWFYHRMLTQFSLSFRLRTLSQEPPFRSSQVWLMVTPFWPHSDTIYRGNVRIVNSKVHPLDSSSTPYAFSSSTVPLLHQTARALNLPVRSSNSYYAFLGMPPPLLTSPSEVGPRRSGNNALLPVTVMGTCSLS